MDEDAVFKRYDVRGKYPGELDEEFFELMGKSVGTFSRRNYDGEVVVCRDNKTSSPALKKALISGIVSTGADVYDAGVGPTDYCAFAGRRFGCISVQVTSSHLRLVNNGLKFMYAEGNGFVNKDLDKLEQLFRQRSFETGKGVVANTEKATKGSYRREMKSYLERFPGDFEGKTVMVDSMGGATRHLLPQLLEELGADVIDIAAEKPEGPYYDPPNPKPEMLHKSVKKARENNVDLLIATDMDGDRVAAYFEGDWITGDELFGVFAQLFENENVVASIDTSGILEDVAEKQSLDTSYTRVGDPFVMEETLERNAKLSGEPNGHYAFTGFVPYNSGILAGLVLAKINLQDHLEHLPEYFTSNINVEVEDKDQKMQNVEKAVKEHHKVVSDIDGIKFETGDATVLIRPSGSSAVIRVKAESKTEAESGKAAEEAAKLVRNE